MSTDTPDEPSGRTEKVEIPGTQALDAAPPTPPAVPDPVPPRSADLYPEPPAPPARRRSTGPRMRTVVLGVVLLVVSVTSLLSLTTDVDIDAGVVFLGLMVLAGLLLIVGAHRNDGETA